jgi:5-carboxymethyl-2-hydroxymuconate isomerase
MAAAAINLKGLKRRAIRHGEYRIAGGGPGYEFAHVNWLIRKGRPVEVQQNMTQRVLMVLKETFSDRFESSSLSLSVDMKEMRDGIALTLHNIPQVGKQLGQIRQN